MPSEVSCSHCGAAVPLPEDSYAPWLECPRCRARVVNTQYLLRTGERLVWPAVVGTLLLLLGTGGWVFGLGALLVAALSGRGRSEVDLCVHTLCCALAVVAGVLLICAGKSSARRPTQFAFAGLAVVVALVLVTLSGLVVVYAVCLGGV